MLPISCSGASHYNGGMVTHLLLCHSLKFFQYLYNPEILLDSQESENSDSNICIFVGIYFIISKDNL